MNKHHGASRISAFHPAPILVTLCVSACAFADVHANESSTENIVVTAARTPTPALDTVSNVAQLTEEQIRLTNPIHPHQLGVQLPGVWISRGSGQEHLTAIRSPVLTGAGSCGAFLVLEDGIPTRPTGFCNVNQLFEIPTSLARSMEVIRGPSPAVYGSNGLHGTINTLLPVPGDNSGTSVSVEAGSNDYYRTQMLWDSGAGDNAWNAGFSAETDDGFRDDSGFDQVKAFTKNQQRLANGVLSLGASGSWLEQDTAGYITPIEKTYKDDAQYNPNPEFEGQKNNPFRNENPEAFRDAYSVRLYGGWTPDPGAIWAQDYKFFVRNSEMEFQQFFLPGDPEEENGQTSGGVSYLAARDIWDNSRLSLGVDTEVATGWLEQSQDEPTNTGNQFVDLPRPTGDQYDYDVNSYSIGAFASINIPFAERWELTAGLRGEYLYYDYDNQMISGNTTEDGTPCLVPNPPGDPVEPTPPDGGCLYNRPEDRTDDFFNAAPNIGLLYRFSESTVSFTNIARGFRVPQASELYRLQAQQSISDIDSETIDSIETGIRHETPRFSIEAVTYYMKKRDFIFRDSEGINVSDGKTEHYGLETSFNWWMLEQVYLNAVGSWSNQEYAFSRDAGLGEVIEDGNDIDTAPEILASARLGWEYGQGVAEFEWVHNDEYYLDAANTAEYEGHDLFNFRLTYAPTESWDFALRVNNLADTEYADRADLFSITDQYRYFPGREREVFVQATWRN